MRRIVLMGNGLPGRRKVMMQIGGVDNLILKDVKLPSELNDDKKVTAQQEDQKIKEADAAKADAAKKNEEDERKARETEEKVYGNVVGRSSDGDTTRVKEDAMEALETGMVFAKEEKENNLMEFNRDQLNVMVERGDITENRYDHEITRRDEIQEKDEESAFAKSNKEMIEKQKEDAEKKAQEAARERLDEMQGKGSEEENENLQRTEQGMNMLAGGVKGLEIEEEGVLEAAQNGRSEIIDQILNPDDGSLKVIIK